METFGKKPDPLLLARTLWEAIDEKTSDEAEAQGLDTDDENTYNKVKEFISKKARNNPVRTNLRRSVGSPMEFGNCC